MAKPIADGLNRDSFRKWVMLPALAEIGLPLAVRTHDLRHTCASLLIELGAHPKAIQDWLGHSDITVTMNLYGHLFPSLEATSPTPSTNSADVPSLAADFAACDTLAM